ncbi:peptidyl-prolyl cis-trans isomerase [Chitinispirillales bacterium ANBcel5]|uniref:peptidylprolyl isomerase n=1 Tax=Cellulosispirillum alkaliphilum TaxID=3039283 RepID=UPI002A585EF3|nr:peptidyl-prolyl cis-trans isomerase [Chitinispirillales bacterium ANBcel5]
MKKSILPLITVLFLIIVSCSKNNEQSEVVVIVNGTEITNQDISDATEILRQQLLQFSPESILDDPTQMRMNVAQQLVANQLMVEEARKEKISPDPEQVETAFKMVTSRLDEDELEKELAKIGETKESIKNKIEEDMTVELLMKRLFDNAGETTDEESLVYYQNNKENFTAPARVRAGQIVLSFSDSAENDKENARQKAASVLQKVKEGKDFEQLAQEYSSLSRVDMGWIRKGDLRPDIEENLFSLEKGEVSEIISAERAFLILKKTDTEEARQLDFEEVKEDISSKLSFQKRGKLLNGYIDQLIAKADVEYVDPTLIPPDISIPVQTIENE